MNKRLLPGFIFLFVLDISSCAQQQWTNLLDKDFSKKWETYIGPAYDSVKRSFGGEPAGLDNDPQGVFKTIQKGNETWLRISGESFGGISTKTEFENYHLQLQFKWGEKKSAPKKNDKRDSGLLYHAGGNHGADFGFWMRSQEFQIQEGDCGDYWGVAGGSFEVNATKKDSATFVYNTSGERFLFNEKSPNGRRCIKNPDAEFPSGDWNTLDLYCFGDTAVHVVNGKVVMVLYHSAFLENAKLVPLRKGKIQIQSEGAEVFYRNIRVQKLKALPASLLQ
jgi:hypothetical protein